MKTGKKYLFHSWLPHPSNDDVTHHKFKRSIHKFISSTLQGAVSSCNDVEKILFLTNEWDNIDKKFYQHLADLLVNEVKAEIESRKTNWRILFFFNRQQTDLHKEFYEVLLKLQTDKDGYAQFTVPISS